MNSKELEMYRSFVHEEKTFEIRVATFGERICLKVFLNGAQVSPEYSATIEVGHDHMQTHQESIIDTLAETAAADIRRGVG